MNLESVLSLTVTRVISANRLLQSPVGVTTYRKNRERWAVILKKSGRTYYTVNGRSLLSDSTHPVLLPRGCSYCWTCTEPGECLIIEFDATTQEKEVFSFTVSDNSFFLHAFSKLEKSLHYNNPYTALEAAHLLYGILFSLTRTAYKEYAPKDKQKMLRPAMDYITSSYYDSAITNDRLAGLCGISTVYFRKTFEGVYGLSPIKYLHNFRINKAKAILLSDYESISQVAESVGYNSIYHFSKMFRAHTGISPTEYAKSQQKSKP